MDKHELEQTNRRKALRKLGFAFLIPGVLMIGIGLISFFLSAGSFQEPKLFFLIFLGMPFTFVGSVLLGLGYMKSYANYASKELRPIAKDNINYIIEGTKESVGSLIRETKTEKNRCSNCGEYNDQDARFCDNCGKSLIKICRFCHEENDMDAKYCKNCGKEID
jgi:ribosomal protein L40E